MPQPPAKKLRLSTSAAYDNVPGIHEQRRKAELKLKSRFDAIYEKYDRDFTGIGDIIDIQTGELVVDNGHLRNMRHDRDIGVSVLRPAPVIKKPNTRKGKKAEAVKPSKRKAAEGHDELSSPMPGAVEEAEDIPSILPAEGSWAKPEELNDPVSTTDSPANIASRVNLLATPGGEQLDLTNPEHLARFTQNIIVETIRQQQILSSATRPISALLPAPPASEVAVPIEPVMSIWGEFANDESEDDDGSASDILVTEPAELRKISMTERVPFSAEDDATLLRMRNDDKMTFRQIESQMGRKSGTAYGRYRKLKTSGAQCRPPPVAGRMSPSDRQTRKAGRATSDMSAIASRSEAQNKRAQELPGSTSTKKPGRSRRSLQLPVGPVTSTENRRLESLHSNAESTSRRRSARFSGNGQIETGGPEFPTFASKARKNLVVADSFEAEEAQISSSTEQNEGALAVEQGMIHAVQQGRRQSGRHAKSLPYQQNISTTEPSQYHSKRTSSAQIPDIDPCEITVQLIRETTASQTTEEEAEATETASSSRRDIPRRVPARFSHIEIPLPPPVARQIVVAPIQAEAHDEPTPQLEDDAKVEEESTETRIEPNSTVAAANHANHMIPNPKTKVKTPTNKTRRRSTITSARAAPISTTKTRSTPQQTTKIKSSPRSPHGDEAHASASVSKQGHEVTYRAIPADDDGSDDELGNETMHCDSILGA